MSSISIRFALTSVSVALLILAITGTINYIFLKKELLSDATQKAKLIEENSIHKIQTIIKTTQDYSKELKESLQKEGYDKKNIQKLLQQTLHAKPYFYGSTIAFKPNKIYKEPYSPYYYKKKKAIASTDLAQNNYNYQNKEWYTTPKKSQQASWSEPYFDEGGGNILMATYSNPIIKESTFLAVVTIDLSLKNLQELISSIHILESGYAFLLSKEHKILVHPDNTKIMQTYYKDSLEYNKIIQEKNQWLYYAHIPSTGLTLGIVLPSNELFSSLHTMSLLSIILAIVGSFLLIITMVLISRRITKPLKEVTQLTEEISLGNFDAKIKLQKTKDEIYSLSLAINRMQDSIKHYIEELKTATIEKQKVESELNIAREIQMSMLPKQLQLNKYVKIEAILQPAKAVGGDFYDFFYLNESKLCFVIADVSGKGVPAALFMSVTMSYIRAYSSEYNSPATIVNRLNNTMSQNNDTNMFVTLFLAILDTSSGTFTFVNAGHTEPYLLSKEQGLQTLNAPRNPIVGAFEDIEYKEMKSKLEKEEKLFLYTDGVNEAYSKDDVQFGEERLRKILKKSITLSPQESLSQISKAVSSFCKESEQSDDITMLCIEYN